MHGSFCSAAIFFCVHHKNFTHLSTNPAMNPSLLISINFFVLNCFALVIPHFVNSETPRINDRVVAANIRDQAESQKTNLEQPVTKYLRERLQKGLETINSQGSQDSFNAIIADSKWDPKDGKGIDYIALKESKELGTMTDKVRSRLLDHEFAILIPKKDVASDTIVTLPENYYVFIFDTHEQASLTGSNEITKRGIFKVLSRHALKKAYTYSRLNETFQSLAIEPTLTSEYAGRFLVVPREKALETYKELRMKVKKAGLHLLYLPTMLVNVINVHSQQDTHFDFSQKTSTTAKRKRNEEYSITAYALQKLGNNRDYETSTGASSLMDSKHRIYEDGIVLKRDNTEGAVGAIDTNAMIGIGNVLSLSSEEPAAEEEECSPVTWYTIFHHSVFGTPKLCQDP